MNRIRCSKKKDNLKSQFSFGWSGLFGRLCVSLWILIIASGLPVSAEDVDVFGPVQFKRESGKPMKEEYSISVANTSAPHHLIVIYGSPGTAQNGHYASSGNIYWNGDKVVGPSDFNKNAPYLTVPVTTRSTNTLSVELLGKPGSSLSVQLVRSNQPPVAHAGTDQTLTVGDLARLDGSGSTDADGDALGYHWRLLEIPENSGTRLNDSSSVRPELQIDRFGRYRAELIVNDGYKDSLPVQTVIDTRNSAPVANAGENQNAFVGATVVVDGGLSYDIDGSALNYHWVLAEKPEASQAVLIDDQQQQCRIVIDKSGHYGVRLVVNDGELNSEPDLAAIDTQNSPPVSDAGEDRTVYTGTTVQLDGALSHDVDGDVLNYAWSLLAKPDGSGAILEGAGSVSPLLTPDIPGLYISQLQVSDHEFAGIPDTAVVTAMQQPSNHFPVIDSKPLTAAVAGKIYRYAVHADDPDGDSIVFVLIAAPQGMSISPSGLIEWIPSDSGRYSVTVGISDGQGGADNQSYTLVVDESQDSGLPPDPSTIATEGDPTRFETMAERSAFLYSGDHPIQFGVNEGTINPKRTAAIRGAVYDKNNRPLPGVTIAVKDHPELGHTLTRADGVFDMIVNGGGQITLDYGKSGYLPLQRTIQTQWQDYVHAEDVMMIAPDDTLTIIDLNNASQPFQVAQGSLETDSDGQRQAAVLFPQGVTASMLLADGSTQPIAKLTVRATEYTVGQNGPKRMPGSLPPTSGYTYAVELSVDEAIAKGAAQVNFSKPLPVYVDNFLNFPVGQVVPAGWYDRNKAAWIPSDNGRVVKILSIDNQLAKIDSDGDGLADTSSKLEALGITTNEQSQLAKLYPSGKSLWRTPIKHFTPWDFNWPWGPPSDAILPPAEEPKTDAEEQPECPSEAKGCVIQIENQVLGEDFPISGTGLGLHYRSDRVPGRTTGRSLSIPLSGDELPDSITGIKLTLQIAGQIFSEEIPVQTAQTKNFTWNGLDVYGRELSQATATVKVEYSYPVQYYAARSDLVASFAIARSGTGTGTGNVIGTRGSSTISTVRTWSKILSSGKDKIPSAGLGSLTLSNHHSFDGRTQTLYRGDGAKRSNVIDRLNRIETRLANVIPFGRLGFDADGSFYFSDHADRTIKKVSPNGDINIIVTGTSGPDDVAVGANGEIYIADDENNRIQNIKTAS